MYIYIYTIIHMYICVYLCIISRYRLSRGDFDVTNTMQPMSLEAGPLFFLCAMGAFCTELAS